MVSVDTVRPLLQLLEAQSVPFHIDGLSLESVVAGVPLDQSPDSMEVAVHSEAAEGLKVIARTCRLRGWRVVIRRYTEDGYGWKKGDIINFAFKRRRWYGVPRREKVDIYLKYLEGTNLYWKQSEVILRVPVSLSTALDTTTISGLDLPCPRQIQEYLSAFGAWKERADEYDLTGSASGAGREMLVGVTDLLEQFGVDYHLEGGTLLGIVRDGDLIPWDHDLDISIPESAVEDLQALVPTLRRRGWRVSRRFFLTDGPVWGKGQTRILRIRARRWLILKGDLCLDVFVKYTSDGYSWWQAKKKTMRVDARHYAGHSSVAFGGTMLRAPVDPEGYLEAKYGDWRIPRKDWDCAHDERTIIIT